MKLRQRKKQVVQRMRRNGPAIKRRHLMGFIREEATGKTFALLAPGPSPSLDDMWDLLTGKAPGMRQIQLPQGFTRVL